MSNKHIKHFTRSPAVAEKADRTARLSRIANQHADDGAIPDVAILAVRLFKVHF